VRSTAVTAQAERSEVVVVEEGRAAWQRMVDVMNLDGRRAAVLAARVLGDVGVAQLPPAAAVASKLSLPAR
jgi:hypothetical protein